MENRLSSGQALLPSEVTGCGFGTHLLHGLQLQRLNSVLQFRPTDEEDKITTFLPNLTENHHHPSLAGLVL